MLRFANVPGCDPTTAGCLSTRMWVFNAVPAVNELQLGWVTPLDLSLIPGGGMIR